MFKQTLVILILLLYPSIYGDTVDLSHAAFETLRSTNQELKLLDVRTPKEYAEGYINGAINTPHDDIELILKTVNKEDTIILYCRSGRRAGLVADALEKSGFSNLYHLDGDINAWIAKGKPLEK